MGLIINGQFVETPGLRTVSWMEDMRLRVKMGEDARVRQDRWVRGIVLHTTKGIPGGSDQRPQKILPGFGPFTDAGVKTFGFWSRDPKQSSAHLVVDFDGTISQGADLVQETTFHANHANEASVGIEIYQGSDAELYEGQLNVVVALCDTITRYLGIQRQVQRIYHGHPIDRMLGPCTGPETCARNVVGVYGHRDTSNNRGRGDPGDYVIQKLLVAGYEGVDFLTRSDIALWRHRQAALRASGYDVPIDGVPGPATVRALAAAGRPHGLWVSRPGDAVVRPPLRSIAAPVAISLVLLAGGLTFAYYVGTRA